jgi:hypothetical protein
MPEAFANSTAILASLVIRLLVVQLQVRKILPKWTSKISAPNTIHGWVGANH